MSHSLGSFSIHWNITFIISSFCMVSEYKGTSNANNNVRGSQDEPGNYTIVNVYYWYVLVWLVLVREVNNNCSLAIKYGSRSCFLCYF